MSLYFYLDCFVPRNDDTCSTSLRGGTTKQSRNKSVILVTLPLKGGRGDVRKGDYNGRDAVVT